MSDPSDPTRTTRPAEDESERQMQEADTANGEGPPPEVDDDEA